MKTTIKDKYKWITYYHSSGMTATEWLRQILGSERVTELQYQDVLKSLQIKDWSYSSYLSSVIAYGFLKAQQSLMEKLTEEVQRLASELDEKLHALTAVEAKLVQSINQESQTDKERLLEEKAEPFNISSGPDLFNRFFIVNEVDRPTQSLIAELRGGKLHYIAENLIDFPPMFPDRATPLERFGVGLHLRETETERILTGSIFGPSQATYQGGTPRPWQGSPHFTINIDKKGGTK